MKLYFKQRMFSWFDSYDIYHMDDSGAVAFTVEGKLTACTSSIPWGGTSPP